MATSASGGNSFCACSDRLALGRVPQIAQQRVEDRGARMADFQAAAAGAMQQLEPVRFHLQEGLVAGQFLAGVPARRQRQPRGGARFDLLQAIPASGASLWVQNPIERKRRTLKPCGRAVFVRLGEYVR